MQLALYENNQLILDLTPYVEDNQIEFTTGEYGFGYLKVNTRILLPQILQLYNAKKVYHVRLGFGSKVIWEGRLEDVEIRNNPTLVAYGYWRSFSDLQVTDLWSDTKVDNWKVIPVNYFGVGNLPQKYTTQIEANRIYQAYNKNGEGGGYTMVGYLAPIGSKKIECISYIFNFRDTPTTSMAHGLRGITEGFVQSNSYYSLTTSVSGLRMVVTQNTIPNQGMAIFLQELTSALFIGETGDISQTLSNIRIGSTPSISGNRLYADEVVRFYTSGVYTLNPTQINPTTKYIQSPQYDITDLQFNDVTGIDAIQEVLKYPSTNGLPYRFQVWEDKTIYFEPKTARNTYYARFSDLKITRTFDTTYTQDRIVYQDANDITQRTAFYTLQQWNTQRQSSTKIDNVSITAVQTAKIADSTQKERIEIITDWLQTTQGNFVRAYECRSGDKIIFIDLPGYLLDVVDNSFMVQETITNMQTGLTRIIPEQTIAQLDNVIARSKL